MYPRSSPKKIRRALVLSAAIIFLGEILAGFLIDRAPSEIRFPDVSRIIRGASQRGRSPDVIFFGSSRTQAQVDALAIEQELARTSNGESTIVFNAGISYGEPVVFDFLSRKLLEAGARPTVAVIEVSPETVSRRLLALDVHLTRQFTWAEALESLPHTIYARTFLRFLSTRFIPVYLFREEFRQWALKSVGLQFFLWRPVENPNPRPIRAIDSPERPLAERLAEQAILTRSRLRHFQISGIAPRALERIAERYLAVGVTTILLGVSISSPSRKEYLPEIDAAYLAFMDRLRTKYGARFVDYRDRVPDELFRSAYYTTPQGALYLSRLLTREVLAPLWQNRGTGTNAVRTQIDATR